MPSNRPTSTASTAPFGLAVGGSGRTYDRGGNEIGPPKIKKSVRIINVPKTVLDKLDNTNEDLPQQG
jgi:hypothetical protein